MSDFFIYSLEFERVDFFHFGGNHDGYDSDDMKLGGVHTLDFLLKVAVHDLDGSKVCFGVKVIGGNDLNHPVEHSRSETRVNFMVIQKPSHSLRIGISVEYISAIKHAVSFGVIFWEFWLMEVGMLGPLGGGVVLEVCFKKFVIK